MAPETLGVMLQTVHRLAAGPPGDPRTDGELLQAFHSGGDPAAFEVILRRHGPMVLRVCRRALGSPDDADDAFQATFLLLARGGGSIRKRESLAGWLHGVAYRMAADIRRAAARRRAHEQQASPSAPADPALTAAWQEIQAVLDEEIANLPAAYQEAFTLCCLEQQSCVEVAARLGRDEGTVRNRLSRARKLLRQRLAARGVSLSAALGAAAVAGNVALASVPRALVGSTVKAAMGSAAGQALADSVPANVVSLVDGATRAMTVTKGKTVVWFLVGVAGLVGGLVGLLPLPGLSSQPPAKEPPAASKAAKPAASADASSKDGPADARGRVLDPEGKPVGGALVVLTARERPKEELAKATTGADGRFLLKLPRDRRWLSVVATAKGLGPDWTHLDPDKAGEITLRLAADDIPVTGRIVDLEGKAVAGASVSVIQIGKPAEPRPAPGGRSSPAGVMPARKDTTATETKTAKPASDSITSWVEQNVKWLATHGYAFEGGLVLLDGAAVPAGLTAPVKTDKDGRFRLAGVGRERAVVLDVRGPGIERRGIWVATVARPPKGLDKAFGLYGPSFEHQAGPGKPAIGAVTDKETGKPLAGVRVVGSVPRMGQARGMEIDGVTDAKGNYRLEGLPKGDRYFVTVDTLAGLTYLPQEKELGDTEGLKPLRADFALVRGTVVEGRLLDQETGNPVQGELRYYPLPGNAQYQSAVRTRIGLDIRGRHPVGGDGSFKLLIFPGPGVVCATGEIDEYLLAAVTEKDAELGVGGHTFFGYQELFGYRAMNGHAYHVVRPGEKPEALKFDLKLERGRTVTGSVTAGGKAAPGARPVELRREGAYDLPVRVSMDESTGAFTAVGLHPRKHNLLVFYREKERQVGFAEPRGDGKGPVAVRLQSWGKVQGRILDADGKPVAGLSVALVCRDANRRERDFTTGPLAKPVTTGHDGRYQVEGLVPGLPFELHVRFLLNKDAPVRVGEIPNVSVKSGETKDLGDLKVQVPRQD